MEQRRSEKNTSARVRTVQKKTQDNGNVEFGTLQQAQRGGRGAGGSLAMLMGGLHHPAQGRSGSCGEFANELAAVATFVDGPWY